MTSLEAVAYVSSAVGSPTEAELEALLLRARAKNVEAGVTGVLLYHDGSFFQYFEGPADGVQLVHERVHRSPLHRGLIELVRRPIEARAFSDWSMGFTRAPSSAILRLSNAVWTGARNAHGGRAEESMGMKLLQEFWRTNVGIP